jgi:UDP-glucose 4-epimerase
MSWPRFLNKEHAMANYLITGGCGFIGSHLADALLNQGHSVRVLDDLSTGKRENLPKGAELIVGDIVDGELVADAMQNIDGCFHLAAVSSVQKSNEEWAATHRVNLSGSINVFDAAREGKVSVVYASSAAVYGDNADLPLRESASLRPLTAYGADKLGNELHARVASMVHGVPTTGMRFFNVYGPRQDPSSPYSGVISVFADRLLKHDPLIIHGDGEQTRDFVFVEDVVMFLLSAMERSGSQPSVFNVCTGKSTSINQLAKVMMSVTGANVPVSYQASRAGDIRASVGQSSLSSTLLGVQAQTDLASGLRELISFTQEQTKAA